MVGQIDFEIRVCDVAGKSARKRSFSEFVSQMGKGGFLMVAREEVVRLAAEADEKLDSVGRLEGFFSAFEDVLHMEVVNKFTVKSFNSLARALLGVGLIKELTTGEFRMGRGNDMM